MASPIEILSVNLRTLMAASRRLSRLPDITAASGGRLSNGTLDRIRRAAGGVNIAHLEALAEVFGLEPWQLLYPGLRAESAPDGSARALGLPDWPFEMVERGRYLALQEPSRGYVQGQMAKAIADREDRATIAAPQHPARDRIDELANEAVLVSRGRRTPRQSGRKRG